MSYIQFIDTDARQLEDDLIRKFEQAYGTTLYPGDERRIFLMQMVPILLGLKSNINDSANQNLLSNARRQVLDELGGSKTPRLPAKKAVVTLRFALSAIQVTAITVPAWTRVTPDGKIYFATTTTLVIPIGQTTGDIVAEATEVGEAYNGYIAGQIKTIVDPIPFVASVVNLNESSGGTDTESDDHYRGRIRLAAESISTAGPEGGYIYWAKTADARIVDVAVTSPTPNVIDIVVLMEGGELPGAPVLDAVMAAVSPRDRRPMGDDVHTLAPTVETYNIALTYYISAERKTEETSIRAAIENIGGAIDQYKEWQCAKLGRDINPDYLRQLMLNAGSARINLTSPAYASVEVGHVAKVGTVTVTYGGLI